MSTQIGVAAGYIDLLMRLDAFLTTTGHAWGATYAGVGDGRLRGPGGTTGGYIGTADSAVETIAITATSATEFAVTGTVSGSLGTATVDIDFSSSVIAFRVVSGGIPFQVGDQFLINLSPRWQRLRLGGCAESTFRTANFSSVDLLYDDSASTVISTTVFPALATLQMIAPTEVRSIAIWCGTTATAPSSFALQWSDDGAAWTTAQTWTGQTWPGSNTRRDFILASAPGAHRYWRLQVTAAASGTLQMGGLRLFGDASGKWDVSLRAEFALVAPGVDGEQQIFVAGYTSTSVGSDYYNWVFRGFRYWDDRDRSVLDVLNHGGDKALLLTNAPIAYWFVANGGHVKVVTRVSSVYQWSYSGYGLPYELPSNHPYPYLSGASWVAGTARWDLSNAGGFRNPADPGSNVTGINANATLAACYPDGAWRQVCNRVNLSNASEGTGDSTRGKCWPYAVDAGGTVQTDHLREALDGTRPLIPVVIYNLTPAHCWGEMDGVRYVTGYGAIAEAIVRDGAVDYLVVPNVNRSTINAYAALGMD